jgi:hypothetical protein
MSIKELKMAHKARGQIKSYIVASSFRDKTKTSEAKNEDA